MKNGTFKPRIVRPEEEDRRTDRRVDPQAKKAGVESLPDGEKAAAEEAKKARDD
jgi:hypothetical protein